MKQSREGWVTRGQFAGDAVIQGSKDMYWLQRIAKASYKAPWQQIKIGDEIQCT